MTQIIFAVLLLFAVAVLVLWLKSQQTDSTAKPGIYFARKSLFTVAERSFLGVLDGQLPSGVRVFGKVRLEDILGVKAGLSRSERQAARNRINRKHVDFLIVRASDLAPLAGIELDDASHEQDDRHERDVFVNSVFASAGLPLLHIIAQKSYNPAEIRTKLSECLKP